MTAPLDDLAGEKPERWFRAARERYEEPPSQPPMGWNVPFTSLNVRLSDPRGLQLTIAAALAADLAAHDPATDAAVGLLAAAFDRVRVLKKEELQVFDAMLSLSSGKIYRVWLNEADILQALEFQDLDRDSDAYRRTLASMKSRSILEEGAGKWRAIR